MVAKVNHTPTPDSSQVNLPVTQEPLPSTYAEGNGNDGSSNAVPVSEDGSVNPQLPEEVGGYKGPDPTRYGDWEHKGRCTDF